MSNIVTDTHALGREMQKARIKSCYQPTVATLIKKAEVQPKLDPVVKRATADQLLKVNRDIDNFLNLFRKSKPKKTDKPLEKVIFQFDETIPICSRQIDIKLSKAVDTGILSDDDYLYFIDCRSLMKAVDGKFKNGGMSRKKYNQAVEKTNEMLQLLHEGMRPKKVN